MHYTVGGNDVTVTLRYPATEATWTQIKAAAEAKGIILDAPDGYTGGWKAGGTSLTDDTPVNTGDVITPDFTKQVLYRIVYDPINNSFEDVTYTIQYPATYVKKTLEDIFSALCT